MIKKIFKSVRGFTPLELVLVVGMSALAVAALVYVATAPKFMAQQPVNVNISIDEEVLAKSRQPAAKADTTDCNSTYVVANTLGGFDVTPASDVSLDAVNVQCAIDNADEGGTVKLKAGAFYFADAVVDATAPSGYKINYNADAPLIPSQFGLPPFLLGANHGNDKGVFVTQSVNIIGEKDSGGNHLSKIVGGYTPISVGRLPGPKYFNFLDDVLAAGPWVSVDTTSQALDVTIKDLEFADPFGSAIALSPVTGATVEGNKFVDGRGMDIVPILSILYNPGDPNFVFYHTPQSYSVIVASPGMSSPHLTKGDVNVVNNVFEGHDRLGDSNDPWVVSYPDVNTSYRGLSIAVRSMSVSANVTVANNTIKNMASASLASEDILSFNGVGGNLVYSDNTIDMSSRTLSAPDFNPAIWANDYGKCDASCRGAYENMGITVGDTNLVAKNNSILANSPFNYPPGVIFFENINGATVKSNNLNFVGESGYRLGFLMIDTSDSLFGQNKLSGKATAGVVVVDSFDNVFNGNNLSGLEATYNNFEFYNSSENIVKGYTGGAESVIDSTGENLLTGVEPVPNSGIGDTVSELKGKIEGLKNNYKSWPSALDSFFKEHPEYSKSN